MTYIELDESQRGLSRSQVLNTLFAIVTALGMMAFGLSARSSALNATLPFVDAESGVRARLPAGWLLTTDDPAFVVQAQDPSAIPFKTVLRISLLPVGEATTPRNVVDNLTLERAGRLANYRVLSVDPFSFGEDPAIELNYAYVQDEINPFVNAVPLVVQGRDVVIIREGGALIATYLEERSRFAANEAIFEVFLASLEF